MEFDPAFPLLAKFNIYLHTSVKTEDDVRMVSNYLGSDLPNVGLDERITLLSKALSDQNGFLSDNLESDEIYETPEYKNSMFVREVVANNRINRQNRASR